MKIIYYIGIGLLALATSCSSVKVFSEKEGETPLTAFKTYAFVSVPLEELDQPTAILYEEIRKRVASQLNRRGYTLDTKEPDMVVAFNILTEESRKEVTKNINPAGMYSPYGMRGLWSYNYPWGMPYNNFRYKEIHIERKGTMVMDMISSQEKQPVWRGIGIGPVNDPEERFETAYKVVDKLFKKFPK